MGYVEFANRILFGETLEDKLVSSKLFTCAQSQYQKSEILKLDRSGKLVPGRPKHLRLDNWETSTKTPFPTLAQMESTMMRGRVMHFFANHELLALELMALILLRFPLLPLNFKRSLVQTMAEEQGHLRAYLLQMERFGVSFGEIPLNDFFWRILSEVDSPGQFLAGMSLTFEQANLDFALMYRDAFLTVGDLDCAKIMNDVYLDEIGHVRLGLAWSRTWDQSVGTDWERYLKHMPERLSPLRAKGQVFSLAARREVGFDEDFIRQLMTLGGSKGRPPVVWIFSAGAELRASTATLSSQHELLVRQVEADLSPLMGLVAATDDCVITENTPTVDERFELSKIGFLLPEFLKPEDAHVLKRRKLGGLIFWADCPSKRDLHSDLLDFCVTHPAPEKQVPRGNVVFGSKCDSHRILERGVEIAKQDNSFLNLLEKWVDLSSLTPLILEPKLSELSDFKANIYKLLSALGAGPLSETTEFASNATLSPKKFNEFVVKQDQSSSGRERIVCKDLVNLERAVRWTCKKLQTGQRLRCENWFDKRADFSVQLEINAPEGLVRCVGKTRFLSQVDGGYFGAVIGRQSDGFEPELLRFLGSQSKQRSFWDMLEHIGKSMGTALSERGFSGPVGLDMFLYRDQKTGDFKLHPCVELNPRWTQGRVALALQKRILPTSSAVWLQLGRNRFGDFVELSKRLRQEFGFETKSPQILSAGVVFTTSPETARGIWTVLLAASNVRELLEKTARADHKLCEVLERALQGSASP